MWVAQWNLAVADTIGAQLSDLVERCPYDGIVVGKLVGFKWS